MIAKTNFQPGQRVHLIGSPGFVGTFVSYFTPMPSGSRNVYVDWDRTDNNQSVVSETQIAR